MGISKKELMEDYYLDELIVLLDRHAKLSKKRNEESKKIEEVDEVYADEFF